MRLVKRAQQIYSCRLSEPTDLDPVEVVDVVESMLRRLVVVRVPFTPPFSAVSAVTPHLSVTDNHFTTE